CPLVLLVPAQVQCLQALVDFQSRFMEKEGLLHLATAAPSVDDSLTILSDCEAEDFSFYPKESAATIFVLGIKNESLKSDQPLHASHFVIDEEALSVGAALNAAVAISYLGTHVETH
ncbi:unnamed protein product, partial [Prunus brigantina]